MTKQTKHFIEISDIVGVHFECRNCHATVSLERSGEIRVTSLRICPNCQEPWALSPQGSSIELAIKEFIDRVKEFEAVLQRRDEFMNGRGFALSLEIKPEAVRPEE